MTARGRRLAACLPGLWLKGPGRMPPHGSLHQHSASLRFPVTLVSEKSENVTGPCPSPAGLQAPGVASPETGAPACKRPHDAPSATHLVGPQ